MTTSGTTSTESHCHACDYALTGLPAGAPTCPECGASLSAAAFALAGAKRIARSQIARLALLAAPAVGIFGSVPIIAMRRGFANAGGFLLLCLWAGGSVAAYYAAPRRRRNVARAIAIGLPLGVAYFAAVLGIALGIVFTIKLLGDA